MPGLMDQLADWRSVRLDDIDWQAVKQTGELTDWLAE